MAHYAQQFVEQVVALIEQEGSFSLGWFEEDGPNNNATRNPGSVRTGAFRQMAESVIAWLQKNANRENVVLILQGTEVTAKAVDKFTHPIFDKVLKKRASWAWKEDEWSRTKMRVYRVLCLEILRGHHVPNCSPFADEWIPMEIVGGVS